MEITSNNNKQLMHSFNKKRSYRFIFKLETKEYTRPQQAVICSAKYVCFLCLCYFVVAADLPLALSRLLNGFTKTSFAVIVFISLITFLMTLSNILIERSIVVDEKGITIKGELLNPLSGFTPWKKLALICYQDNNFWFIHSKSSCLVLAVTHVKRCLFPINCYKGEGFDLSLAEVLEGFIGSLETLSSKQQHQILTALKPKKLELKIKVVSCFCFLLMIGIGALVFFSPYAYTLEANILHWLGYLIVAVTVGFWIYKYLAGTNNQQEQIALVGLMMVVAVGYAMILVNRLPVILGAPHTYTFAVVAENEGRQLWEAAEDKNLKFMLPCMFKNRQLKGLGSTHQFTIYRWLGINSILEKEKRSVCSD